MAATEMQHRQVEPGAIRSGWSHACSVTKTSVKAVRLFAAELRFL